VNAYRKRRRIVLAEDVEDGEYVGCEELSLESVAIGNISRDELVDFIGELPVSQRDALICTRFLGLSLDETAKKLGVSLPAVRMRLYRARKAILKFTQERNEEYE
ncbi:MAG: RNA polymerase sigma factor, partial [Bacteroides sp.]|nr:RNA polymerase sigma factor [Roseburia sp.]MCM1463760.1 RNA polymerase sigma factor [Bacteroides sp.]